MSDDPNGWLKVYLEDKFATQQRERKEDKAELKNFFITGLSIHQQGCEGYELAINIRRAVKLSKMVYVALPTSIILFILGFLRAFFHF